MLVVGAVVIVSGVTENWMPADNDHEAHTIDVHNQYDEVIAVFRGRSVSRGEPVLGID